jgi:hypothetical protein
MTTTSYGSEAVASVLDLSKPLESVYDDDGCVRGRNRLEDWWRLVSEENNWVRRGREGWWLTKGFRDSIVEWRMEVSSERVVGLSIVMYL